MKVLLEYEKYNFVLIKDKNINITNLLVLIYNEVLIILFHFKNSSNIMTFSNFYCLLKISLNDKFTF